MTRWHYAFFALLILALVAFVAFSVRGLGDRIATAEDRVADSATAADENQEAARRLAEQVERLGGNPVVEPDDLPPVVGEPGPAGESGEPGPQGEPGPAPSQADVATAVALYCSGGTCDGADATPSQVASAVAAYCNNRGECAGPAGDNGTPGADGSNGSDGSDGSDGADGNTGPPGPQGPQGPGPTPEQIAAAVSDYCADGRCRGPEGPRGQTGVGIAQLACDSVTPLELTVTYTDGTQQTLSCGGTT